MIYFRAMEHNAAELQKILNIIMQGIMNIVTGMYLSPNV